MVSTLSVVFMVISLCICFGLPVALLIISCKRLGGQVWPGVLGALVFVFFAMILESSVANGLLEASPALARAVSGNGAAYGIYAGLMAGLFEETGRLVAFLILLHFRPKEENRLGNALSYGIGHGGIEAVLLVGMAYLSNVMLSLSLNQIGSAELLARAGTDPATAAAYRQAIEILTNTPAHHFLAGGIERFITIFSHIALSVLVWMAVSRKGKLWLYPLSILLHMVYNFPVALYRFGIIPSIWVIELLLLLIATACCRLAYTLYCNGPAEAEKDA